VQSKKVVFAVLLYVGWLTAAAAAGNYRFAPGDTVLTNCRSIYTKGVVKAQVDDGYTIHFPKRSGPINCPPFRWHAEFVLPFQSVPEYRLKFFGGLKRDLVFKVGENVTFQFPADKRIIQNQTDVTIDAQITDISDVGAIAVKLVSSEPEAAAMFWQMIGSNYVDLRHEALALERNRR